MALTRIEQRSIRVAVLSGFTFTGDSQFITYLQARRVLAALVKKGYLTATPDKAGRTSYTPTDAARDFVTHGIEAGSV